jgi:hypothetical protein
MQDIELLTEFRRRAKDALPGRISRLINVLEHRNDHGSRRPNTAFSG